MSKLVWGAAALAAWLCLAIGIARADNSAYGGGQKWVVLSAASNNSQLIGIPGPHLLLELTPTNSAATAMYVRLYDVAAPPTCSSATGEVALYVVPANTVSMPPINLGELGATFQNGIGVCITGAFSLTDNTNAATGLAVNFTIK